MSNWSVPTYQDAHPELVGNPLVRCNCGRVTNADMMRDVRRVPDQVIPGSWICDACQERLHMEGRLTREEFARLLGAPISQLQKVAAFEQRRNVPQTEG